MAKVKIAAYDTQCIPVDSLNNHFKVKVIKLINKDKLLLRKAFFFFFERLREIFLLWPCQRHAEIHRPGTEPEPEQ